VEDEARVFLKIQDHNLFLPQSYYCLILCNVYCAVGEALLKKLNIQFTCKRSEVHNKDWDIIFVSIIVRMLQMS